MMTNTAPHLQPETRQELMVAQKSTAAALLAAQAIDIRRLPRAVGVRDKVHEARENLRNANAALLELLG